MTRVQNVARPSVPRSVDDGARGQIMRSGAWLVVLLLAALPLAAQQTALQTTSPACGALSPAMNPGSLDPGTYRPIEVEKRLFFSLSGLDSGVLVVRYFLEGEIYLTETIDLASVELPQVAGTNPRAPARAPAQAPGRSETKRAAVRLLDSERVIELMALRPDLVTKLHKLAGGGAWIDLEVLHDGELLATMSFDEIVERSAALRESEAVPVVVYSTVEGPGDSGRPADRLAAKTYLEDCGDCTTSTPCDTECGWDEGKGGPVTCGEYGICEPATCECSRVSYEYWTGWYLYSFYPGNPAQYQCLASWLGGYRWHRLWAEVYRRDYVQRRQICPNCPTCLGCYIEEEVIGYQLSYGACWYEEVNVCYGGYTPCCSDLCVVTGLTPCFSWC